MSKLLRWTQAGLDQPKCGARRGKRAYTYCELPNGHLGDHLGRSRSGKWFSWPEVRR